MSLMTAFNVLRAVFGIAKELKLDIPSTPATPAPKTRMETNTEAFFDGLLEKQNTDETSFPDRVSEISMCSLIMSVVIGLPVYLAAIFIFGQTGMTSLWYGVAAMYIVICFKYPIIETTFLFLIYIGLGLSFSTNH